MVKDYSKWSILAATVAGYALGVLWPAGKAALCASSMLALG